MPSAPLRYCSFPGCGQRTTQGRCEAHRKQQRKAADQYRQSAAQRGYDAGWRKFRAMYLAANPLCVDCKQDGRVAVARDVHHVDKLADGGAKLDPRNCMALCHECHSRRTARGE